MTQSNRLSAVLMGAALVVALLLALQVPLAAVVPLLAVLACPLMMVVMMRGMHR